VQELLAWIEWTRSWIPHRREFAQPERFRGRTVRFGDTRPSPQLVFDQLALDGDFSNNGQTVPFTGTVTGLTNEPAVYGRPATVDVETGGDTPVRVHAVLDRTGRSPHDYLVLELPSLEMPARKLGKAKELAVALAPGRAAVKLEIELRDDTLAGQLAFVQNSVQLETTLAAAYGGEAVQTRVNQALAQVKQLNVTVDLSGTLRRPSTRLHSDLGAQVAEGLTTVARQELQARVEQLTGRVDSEVSKHLSELERLVSTKSDELLARLAGPRAELEKLVAAKSGPWNLDQLSNLPQPIRAGQLPKLPVRDLFTR
jgi:uncharacterized protein (TIGR03545 family)